MSLYISCNACPCIFVLVYFGGGKIRTQVFASDSPYDRQKAGIGSVITPMFEPGADVVHLMRLERLIRGWVDFVREEPDPTGDFRSFQVGP
jgi:hypothetical protein